MKSIQKSIQQQIETNQSKNLLYLDAAQYMEITPAFQGALEEMIAIAKKIPKFAYEIPNKLIFSVVQKFIEKIYSINQYLRVTDREKDALENIYRQTWQKILRTGDIQGVLREYHYPELSRWIGTMYPPNFLEYLRFTPVIGNVVCKEYSAQFQIEILGLTIETIKEPLIDIGCGSQAALVQYLRMNGIDAYGIDRLIESQEFYLHRKDWFEYVFETKVWGTIISNMAYTNHLIYAYWNDQSRYEHFLRKTREIFASLVEGGSFYYAPSVLQIEKFLSPTQFQLERRQITEDVSASKVTRVMH
ncbi:MAG: hypothetical protein PHW73_14215 [Atribacterota bacterium]|nr:hypothetical protein [Atribacterota bacterium]